MGLRGFLVDFVGYSVSMSCYLVDFQGLLCGFRCVVVVSWCLVSVSLITTVFVVLVGFMCFLPGCRGFRAF